MTRIQIAHEVPANVVEKIETLLEEAARTDPNWNGAEFMIERADFTSIPDDESLDAVCLYRQIIDVISPDY
jgi:hypothetical protein